VLRVLGAAKSDGNSQKFQIWETFK
jgi:hypothetical protein